MIVTLFLFDETLAAEGGWENQQVINLQASKNLLGDSSMPVQDQSMWMVVVPGPGHSLE